MDNILTRRIGMALPSGGDRSDGYYGTDLIIRLDGINNTRQGHQRNLAYWENLVSPTYDFALTNPTVNTDSVYFPADCGAFCDDDLSMPAEYTVEIYFSLGNDFSSIENDAVLIRMMKSNQYGILFFYKWNNNYCYPDSGKALIAPQTLKKNTKYGCSLVKNGTTSFLYVNGTKVGQGHSLNSAQNIVSMKLNAQLGTEVYSSKLLSTIYSLRVYSDALSADTVLANYNNDVLRFS